MKKTAKSKSKAPIVTKHPISIEELNSPLFSFDEQMLYEPSSKWNDFKHWIADVKANAYRWYNGHPITIYSLKRIFYGLITLIIAICVIALLVHTQTDISIFDPQDVDKLGYSEQQIDQLRQMRMAEFGYSTNPLTFLGNFLYNLMPFIPKTFIVSQDAVPSFVDGKLVLHFENVVTQTVFVYLGQSVRGAIAAEGTPVVEIFNSAIPYSFAFGGLAIILAFLLGIPLGIEAAKRKAKAADNVINGANLFLAAVPALILTLAIYILATAGLGTSSVFSNGSFWAKFWPFITILLFQLPPIVIMTRRYVIDEMTADYTKFAYSQGFSINKVYYIYIFRNAGIKVIRDFPQLFLATLFGSSMLVETQWGIPGMSAVMVSASSGSADPFVILGYVSFTAFIEVFASLMGDLVLVGLDPRVSLGRK